MIKLAVAGKPISHSLSPLLHTTAYEILGIKAEFLAEEVSEDTFADFTLMQKVMAIEG